MRRKFTSESVTSGHPDKICDQIADRILDELLMQDPAARCACEVTCIKNDVHIFGEITSDAFVNYEEIARNVIANIGYTDPQYGFCADTCRITVDLTEQSSDISMGISRRTKTEELNSGAGDQGIMFGYACKETSSLMPLPIELAHSLAKRLEEVRKYNELPWLLPDGKTQVTIAYENDKPVRIDTVIVSCQHRPDIKINDLRDAIMSHVIMPTLPTRLFDQDTQFFINPAGRFVNGGPMADAGLTGRKLMVDTYGGTARNGGGAMSGKDSTKTDRCGAYMARYIAKNIVSAGLAEKCEVQLSYAIGLAEPISVQINTFGTSKVPEDAIYTAVMALTDLRPAAIINNFHLQDPIYAGISCYGQFGFNAAGMPWEQTDLAQKLNKFLKEDIYEKYLD